MELTSLIDRIQQTSWYKKNHFNVKNIIFALLPFRALFTLTVLFKHYTHRRGLDEHFDFFCSRKLYKHRTWIFRSILSKKYLKEILELYNLTNESINIINRIHSTDWARCATSTIEPLSRIVIRMLEHGNYEFEESAFFSDDNLKNKPYSMPLDQYCPRFFQDKNLTLNLITELELTGSEKIVAALDKKGHYLKDLFAPKITQISTPDINLFYAYRHLALRTYHNGEGHLIPLISKKTLAVQNRLRHHLPTPSRQLKNLLNNLDIELSQLKILSPDWSALIGHNGHLNVHLMMREMGWWKGTPLLLAYQDRIANRPFLSLFDELCPTLTLHENISSGIWCEIASLIPYLGVSHQIFNFEDGRAMYWNDAGAMALNEWEYQNRGFPLRTIYDRKYLSHKINDDFSNLRQKWGMTSSDWYVCLHMRDAQARGEKDGFGESIRNTSVGNYLEAINYITSLGGWVVRMGGNKAPKLPKMPQVIDYATGSDQSPLMDIHLVRNSRFFIGTTSGFAYVASSFGIPTAMVNAISSVGLLWSKDTRFALKPVYTKNGRLLSQQEVTSEQWRWAFPTHESLARAGLMTKENSSDEILETVKEIHELTTQTSPMPESSLMEKWRASLSIPAFYGSATPSHYFLEKYGDLFLPDTAPRISSHAFAKSN